MKISFGEYNIRSWCDDDVEILQRYANNRKIWLNLRDVFPHPYTIEDARWWIEHTSQENPEKILCYRIRGGADWGHWFGVW